MSKFILPFAIVILASCTSRKPDCSLCEEKLEEILMSMTTPLDLPVEKPKSTNSDENQLTAIILENNKYRFDESETEYTFDDYLIVLEEKISNSPVKIQAVKIAGHKFAHYEAVFQVLAFCQANELEPVLAYDK